MNIKKHKKAIIIATIVIIGGGYYWYSQSKNGTQPVRYETKAVEKGTLTVSVTGSGQVEAVNQVDLKPVVAGDAIEVMRVYVKNDQAVKSGDLIALLDAQDAWKAVRNAELDLASAKNKYTQTKKADTSDKYDKKAQKLSVEQKENALTDAKEKVKDYYIRAPFDGTVTGISVGAGDSVSRADILASIISGDIRAKVLINEIDASRVKNGDKAVVKFSALPNVAISGKVAKIDTIGAVSQGVVTYSAEISFDTQNKDLKPSMSAVASITTDIRQDVLIVPSSAIKNQGGKNFVEVLNSGATPQKVIVEVGAANNTETEIVSGLQVGDKVVTRTINPNAPAATTGSSGGFGGSGALRSLR